MDRTSLPAARLRGPPSAKQPGARGAEGWPGRTAVIRASAAGRGQLGGAGLYLWRHRALTPELWGGRQLYHQASVIA